jgi:predicted nucleic acid-binding protein
MTYLLDTNVLSELHKRTPNPAVRAWIEAVPDGQLYISVLNIGEIRRGVQVARERGLASAERLNAWLERTIEQFMERIVPVVLPDALIWGQLTAGNKIPVDDAMLAAQAYARDWTLVTRNIKDVARTGVRLLNPFEYEG